MSKTALSKAIRSGILAGAIGGVGLLLWFSTRPTPLVVQGEVSADRVDVSPRVGGRIVHLAAAVGDRVKQGQVIAKLDNPQLTTGLAAARAALAVAEADFARIASTRPETIAARRADRAAAQSDVTLYQENFARQTQLLRSGNAPQARVDEATRNLEAAQRKREAADAALQLAVTGASPEERALSDAQVKQAQALVDQRTADVAELTVHAPSDGQITTRVAEMGENFGAGAPLYAMIDTNTLWVTFNLREDLLAGLKIGDRFAVTVPAAGKAPIPVRVTVINVQGQFATWRATRATGDFDLRTFEIRAVPLAPVDGLRPGMSAVTPWPPRPA